MQNAETLSHGRVRLAAVTLHGALNTLVEKGFIISLPEENSSKKLTNLCVRQLFTYSPTINSARRSSSL